MALHPPNLLLKYLVPETGFEFALPQRRRRDLHRLLPSAKKNLDYFSLKMGYTKGQAVLT